MKKFLVLSLSVAFLLSGCFGSKGKSEHAGETISKKSAVAVYGAGATFPYPVYTNWAKEYERTTGLKVSYQGIGSGGGIRQVTDRTVNFGGSSKILSPEDLNKRKLYQFPAIIGSIVIVYNLPGVKDGKLKLSNNDVCNIFMGKVQYWDNKEIKKNNPNVKLPHYRITIIHRAEGSGTTWSFTYWLSHVCPKWKRKIGYGKIVKWPTNGIGARGNAGVSDYIKKTLGGIGYVGYVYKFLGKLPAAQLQTKEGNFIKPSKESFKAAASHATWKPENHFYLPGNLLLQPGKDSWPLTYTGVILLPREKEENNKLIIKFFNWAFKNGDQIADKLTCIPLPEPTKKMVGRYWKNVVLR